MTAYHIHGRTFDYVDDAMRSDTHRASYFALVRQVFDVDFAPWYASGYSGENFIPYALYDGDVAAVSVGIALSEFLWQGRVRRFAQVSTVMTHPRYRGLGLNAHLMRRVLSDWRCRSDLVYLYANDSVLDYYPRFGFARVAEYTYTFPIARQPGTHRKMDLSNPADLALIVEKYTTCNNPFSAVTMKNNLSQMLFHCITFLRDHIYYIESYDAVVIAQREGDTLLCYDIYTDAACQMRDVVGPLATGDTANCALGFTPICTGGITCEKSDTPVFALNASQSLFHTHRVTLPLMSRA